MLKHRHAIVMEIGNGQAVVLHPDGSFSRQPLGRGQKVGDIVSLPAVGRGIRWTAVVAAAMVVSLLYTSLVFLPTRQAFAYVSLDGIPGVELTVNSRGNVVSGEAVGPEGDMLLAGLELGQQSLTTSVQQLLNRAKEQGLLDVDQEVVLVTVAPVKHELNHKLLKRVNEQAAAGVQAALQGQTVAPKVEQMLVSKELRAEAKTQGLTPGQYAMALKASDAGVNIDLDQVPGKNVTKALREQGVNPGQIINQLKNDGDLDLDRLMQQNRGKLHGKTKSDNDSDGSQVGKPANSNSHGNGRNKDK